MDIAAQALLFFFAGFDTSSTGLGFTSYELALNPDIQQRLVDDIEKVIEKDGGIITFEGVHKKMKYLDMVISGTQKSVQFARSLNYKILHWCILQNHFENGHPLS